MNEDYIISGVIKRVIRDKYRRNGYVLLLQDTKCESDYIGDQWIKFSSIRLSKIFYNSTETEITLQVEGKKDEENNYKLYKIIDIIDDGYFESDASYLKEILTNYSVTHIETNDIYFRYLEDGSYVMGIITKVRKNEVKLFINGGSDWWYLTELNNTRYIYRIKDIEVIKELMKFALHEDDTLLEVWKNQR
ncbi:hypothetical protein [Mammaliicoccus sciuri]|uniref:hypothetical protein n=1 Tax=Mammaliicoccus sciuri TaxID=1296 RepID=UPI000D1EE9D5|nr:hypothetical protein [Mammaliicoccus sciuri]PTJ52533.1 hypothetical protein BU012_04875 [Mammaliicoccus sciuri]